MSKQQERDVYIIPPNFIDTGTFFGGLFKARNVIEAGILATAVGFPVLFSLPYSLTTRVIILCLTALPLAMVALIGIDGESLSSFLGIFLRFCQKRRLVGGTPEERDAAEKKYHPIGYWLRTHLYKRKDTEDALTDAPDSAESEAAADTDWEDSITELEAGEYVEDETERFSDRIKHLFRHEGADTAPACLNPVADYLPIAKIENGIVYTKDRRYIKIVEVVPINFLLRSAS